MTGTMIEAGIPTTAPSAVADNAAKTQKKVSTKVMVLAVHHDPAGETVITPIDIEHETDDQRELSELEYTTGANALASLWEHEADMKKALASLFQIFDQRLYREKFRNFENFCFAIFGTHRIEDAVAAKAKSHVNKLKAVLEQQE